MTWQRRDFCSGGGVGSVGGGGGGGSGGGDGDGDDDDDDDDDARLPNARKGKKSRAERKRNVRHIILCEP